MRLSQMSEFYWPQVAPEPKGSLWEQAVTEKQLAAVGVEAANFKGAQEAHAQHIIMHVQHHWHREEDDHRVPHPYCRKKGQIMKKGKRKKHGKDEVCKRIIRRQTSSILYRGSSAQELRNSISCQ